MGMQAAKCGRRSKKRGRRRGPARPQTPAHPGALKVVDVDRGPWTVVHCVEAQMCVEAGGRARVSLSLLCVDGTRKAERKGNRADRRTAAGWHGREIQNATCQHLPVLCQSLPAIGQDAMTDSSMAGSAGRGSQCRYKGTNLLRYIAPGTAKQRQGAAIA